MLFRINFWIFILFLIVPWRGYSYNIDEKLEGPESFYTGFILNWIHHWPPQDLVKNIPEDRNPVQLVCIETRGNPYYIGLEQQMIIHAPLERVEAILDDINHYKEFFPGYDDIHVVSRDGNKILTSWEQHIPLFFVPNVKYQVLYLVDKGSNNRRIYRYKLKEVSNLKTSDGVIVLESMPTGTRYFEYDFYDADWGVLKTIAPKRIWKESVEGIYLSDMGIKLKAENPDWIFPKVVKESKKVLELFPVDKAIENKQKGVQMLGYEPHSTSD